MRRCVVLGARCPVLSVLGAVLLTTLLAAPAAAQARWALIVSGAAGGAEDAGKMREWRSGLRAALVDRYGFDTAKVVVLGDGQDEGPRGTAAEVRKAIGAMRGQAGADDLILLVLLGHGTWDGDTAKFNLIGPDLTAAEWADLLRGLPGRLVVVNTTEASYPFVERLSRDGRVVITATDSAAQKYATVFPEYFLKSMSEASTDLDKNGRTSIYEVFTATGLAVRQHYEQRGQLTTERSVLDDNGDGIGRGAQAEGPDGALARTLFLDAEHPQAASDPELAELLRRRRTLEAEAEALKLRKGSMPEDQWLAAFEKLMIELARVSREIRDKT